MSPATSSRKLPLLVTFVWAFVLVAGTVALNVYGLTEGPRGAAPTEWPTELGERTARLGMVVYAHPRCPCTRATLWESAELVAASEGELQVEVLFYVPEGEPASWAHGDLWSIAQETPNTTPRVDPGGRLAAAHGALTSGHCRVYGPGGALLFDGGLTASRGHQGTSAGERAIRAHVRRQPTDTTTTPVFGCGISEETCS